MSTTEIDVTDMVEKLRTTFVLWGVNYVFSVQSATNPILTLPLISNLYRGLLTMILNFLSQSAVMETFFMNSILRKTSEAADYVSAVSAKQNLPTRASYDDYKKAEQNEIDAFNSFVRLT